MNTVKIKNLLLNKLFIKETKKSNKPVKIKFEEALDFFTKKEFLKKTSKENTNDYIKYFKNYQRNLIINKKYNKSYKENIDDNKILKITEKKNNLKTNERTFRLLNKKNKRITNQDKIENFLKSKKTINIANEKHLTNIDNKSNSKNINIISIENNQTIKNTKDLKNTENKRIIYQDKTKNTFSTNERYFNNINNSNDFISSKGNKIVKNIGKLKNTEDIKLNFTNKNNQDNKISFKISDKKIEKILQHQEPINNNILNIENHINKTSKKQKDLKIDKGLKDKQLSYNEEQENLPLINLINTGNVNSKHKTTKIKTAHTKINLEKLKTHKSVIIYNPEIKKQTDNSNISFSKFIKKQSNTNFNLSNNTLFLNNLNLNQKIKSTKKTEVNVSKTIKQLADIIKSKTIVINKKHINNKGKVYPTDNNIHQLKAKYYNKHKSYFYFSKIDKNFSWKEDNQAISTKENINNSFNEINKNIPTNLITQNIQKELKKTYKIENDNTQASISTNNDFSFDQGLDNNFEIQHINQAEKIEHIQSLKENINKLLSVKLNIENISIRASLVNQKLNIAIYTQTFGDIKTMKEEIKSIIQEYGFKEYKLEIKSKDEKISLNSKGKAREINVKV
ncbi:hypothetical protein [Hydrogenothermus marinus]|uniref:Flagellar hook-length control protein FliK n=1 Tax=Hydrogenothermus marinus TaxID=133270 RepID=A0A3M0C3E5_9AQUI|nr:hypothetical protein [Hydrogenothermus marinus]RMA97492.1 hypothetical protein CLV39_0105 [Hydrogenothermus marinus]